MCAGAYRDKKRVLDTLGTEITGSYELLDLQECQMELANGVCQGQDSKHEKKMLSQLGTVNIHQIVDSKNFCFFEV